MECGLDRRPANARQCFNLVDRQVTGAVMFEEREEQILTQVLRLE